MKILLVEDDAHQTRDFLRILDRLQVGEVVSARHGREALQKFLSEEEPFDAVITDMNMPHGDGIYVLQFLEENNNPPPCLVHSSEDTHFSPTTGRRVDLNKLPEQFPTLKLTFHRKWGIEYFEEFLKACSP